MADFTFLGSKITADGDCSHEIKRCLLLGRKVIVFCCLLIFATAYIISLNICNMVVLYSTSDNSDSFKSFSLSLVAKSYLTLLQPHGLYLASLLCPWDSPGNNTGVGWHFLLQGIFPTQELNPGLLHCMQIFYWLSYDYRDLNLFIISAASHSKWLTFQCEKWSLIVKWLL